MRRHRKIGIVLIVLLLPVRTWAEAGVTLEDALSLEERGQLVQALEAFRTVLQAEGNSREDLATIYLHLALLQQASGNRNGARDAMYRLLAVEPEPELPVSAPPEVAELLEEARRLWSGRRLRVEVSPDDGGEGGDLSVEVVVHDDVPGMVTAASLTSEGSEFARSEGRSPFELTVPPSSVSPGGSIDVEVRLLDEHGGTIWQSDPLVLQRRAAATSSYTEEEPVENVPPIVDDRPSRSPLWPTGWVLFGAGLALGGAGGALVAVDERPTGEQRVSEAGIMEERLDTGLAGWILVGVGSAALITGIILLVLGRNRDPHDDTLARVAQALGGVVQL